MDYEKLKEYGQSIKLTDEAKAEITANCKAVQREKRGGIMLTAAAKRTAAVLAAAAVIIAGLSCVKYLKQPAPNIDNTEKTSTVINSAESSTAPSPTETATKSSNVETTENDIGGGELLPRKYRNNYYSIPASFIKIVGRAGFEEWEDAYLEENYPDYSNEMVMVAYVKEFNISKEDFERANLNYAKFIEEHYSHICLDPQDYADQEMQEIYNTDIIYTFNNEIINEYYLGIDYPFLNEYQYEEALEAGTYETRTTDWVDVEQMEAEINAKYGAPEVTETATAIPEETETPE
ncbi:MAG: hypothetical protein J6B52_00670 [Clostridia bacterium]|nr:hypothetical protein [Clostridia bacterium]